MGRLKLGSSGEAGAFVVPAVTRPRIRQLEWKEGAMSNRVVDGGPNETGAEGSPNALHSPLPLEGGV